MGVFLKVMTTSAGLALAMPAAAATLFTGLGGPNYDEMIHNNGSTGSNHITLDTKPSGYLVDYTSLAGETLHTTGGGFAFVAGPFTQLTIDPQGPVIGFSKIGFNLDPTKFDVTIDGKKSSLDLALQIEVAFTAGPSQIFSSGYSPNTKFDILAGAGETMSSIRIFNPTYIATGKSGATKTGSYTFDTIRQVSFDAKFGATPPPVSGVPEPANWAMMIAGFGLVGGTLRHRKPKVATA